MNRIMLRYERYQEELRDRSKIARIVAETIDVKPGTRSTAGGDERKLRGIPAIGRGVSGAINGTRP